MTAFHWHTFAYFHLAFVLGQASRVEQFTGHIPCDNGDVIKYIKSSRCSRRCASGPDSLFLQNDYSLRWKNSTFDPYRCARISEKPFCRRKVYGIAGRIKPASKWMLVLGDRFGRCQALHQKHRFGKRKVGIRTKSRYSKILFCWTST